LICVVSDQLSVVSFNFLQLSAMSDPLSFFLRL